MESTKRSISVCSQIICESCCFNCFGPNVLGASASTTFTSILFVVFWLARLQASMLASQKDLAVRLWQGQWVVCAQTHEVLLLPVAVEPWTLHYASDGLAFVRSGETTVWVSSLQRHLVLQDGARQQVLSHAKAGGEGQRLFQGLLSDALSHKLGPACVSIDRANAMSRTFHVQRLLLPEQGASCYIDLKHFYTANKIETSKFPGTWIRLREAGWKKWFQELGLPEGHVRPGGGTANDEGQLFECASVSVVGLLGLLSRWSAKGKAAMQIAHDHTACDQVLEALLSLLAKSHDIPLMLSMEVTRWQADGFLESRQCANKILMVGGVVRVEELPIPVKNLFSLHGSQVVEKVEVKTLMQALAVEKDLKWFYFQLLVQLGTLVDLQLWLLCLEAAPPEVDSRSLMRKQIQKYTRAARAKLSGKQFLSLAVDASRVAQKKTLLGFMGCETGVAAMAPPQVLADVVLDCDVSTEKEEQARKYRRFVSTSAAWLRKRKAEKELQKTPQKIQRKATYQWLRAVNHMSITLTGQDIMQFRPLPGTNPRCWASLSLAADQGSDATAAYYFMVNKLKMNVELWPDSSHQWQRDIINSWNGLKWKGWTQCMVAVLNFQHGPWDGASRFHELRATANELFRCLKSESHPFLVKYQTEILQELGMDNAETEEGLHSRIVEVLEDHPSLQNRGTKTAMCRFANFVDSCKAINQCWTFYLLRLLFLAFELRQLEGVVMKTAMSNALQGAEQNAEARQTVQQPPSLRKAFTSNLAFAIAMLSDAEGRQRSRVIEAVTAPLRAWYGKQSKELRSLESTLSWLQKQVGGKLHVPLKETLSLLSDASALAYCCIGNPVAKAMKSVSDMEIVRERAYVKSMADYAFQLVGNRCKRTLWLTYSWIPEMLKLVSKDEVKQREAIQSIQESVRQMSEAEDKGVWWKQLVQRSFMRSTSSTQLIQVLEQNGWSCTEDVVTFVVQKLHCLAQSKLVEDSFQKARHLEQQTENKDIATQR
eukprot:1844765-Amphidinium_carterae.3